jgi:hypothetical protein
MEMLTQVDQLNKSSTESVIVKRFRINLYSLVMLLVFVSTLDYRFYIGITTSPVEIVGWITIVLHIIKLFQQKEHFSSSLPISFLDNKALIFYVGWIILAAIFSIIIRGEYTTFFLFRDLLPGFIAYYLVIYYVTDDRKIEEFIKAYLLGSSLHLILGVSQGLTGGPQLVEENWGASEKLDPSGEIVSGNVVRGLFTHPNGFAGFFIAVIILLVSVIAFNLCKNKLWLYLAISFIPIVIFDLVKSYAKGSFFWILLGIAFLFLPKILDKWRHYLGLFLIGAGIAGLILYSLNSYKSSGGALGTIETRLQLTQAAFTAMQEDFFILIFGDGQRAIRAISLFFSHIEYPNAHNGLVNLIVFFGFPALIFYLWASIDILAKLTRTIKLNEGFTRGVSLFLFSSIIASLGNYYFEPLTQSPWQTQYFLLLALSVSVTYPKLKRS